MEITEDMVRKIIKYFVDMDIRIVALENIIVTQLGGDARRLEELRKAEHDPQKYQSTIEQALRRLKDPTDPL